MCDVSIRCPDGHRFHAPTVGAERRDQFVENATLRCPKCGAVHDGRSR